MYPGNSPIGGTSVSQWTGAGAAQSNFVPQKESQHSTECSRLVSAIAALEESFSALEDRLVPVSTPQPPTPVNQSLGTGAQTSPLRSTAVASVAASADRINWLHQRVMSVIGNLEV